MQKTKNILTTLFILCLMMFAILYSDSLKLSINSGIQVCLESIIPSLYFFMVISSMLMDTPFMRFFSRLFDKPAKLIFGFDGNILSIFILSQLGGYPIGIKLLSDLYRKGHISESHAMRCACFCFASGPAFILGLVSDKSALGAILLSCTVSNLIVAFFLCRFSKCEFTFQSTSENTEISLMKSTKSTAQSLLNICLMILFMRAFLAIIYNLGIISFIGNLLNISPNICFAVFEVSYVISVNSVAVSSSLLAFGGICVALQLKAIASFDFNMPKFLTIRILCALLSVTVCNRIYTPPIADEYINAMTHTSEHTSASNVAESFLLIIMCCILLSKNSRQMKNNVL